MKLTTRRIALAALAPALAAYQEDSTKDPALGLVAAEGNAPAEPAPEIPVDRLVLLGDNNPLYPNVFTLLRGAGLIVVGEVGTAYPMEDLVWHSGNDYLVWGRQAAPLTTKSIVHAEPDVDAAAVTVVTQLTTTCATVVYYNGVFRKNVPEEGCVPLADSARIDRPGVGVLFLYHEKDDTWSVGWLARIGPDGLVDFSEIGMDPQWWPAKMSIEELAERTKSQKALKAAQAPKRNPPSEAEPTP